MVGFLLSLAMIFYGWGSFPVGFLADVTSKKRLITLSMLLCGGSAIVVSLSSNLWLTAVGMILLWIGASLYHPCGYSHMALCSEELGDTWGSRGSGGSRYGRSLHNKRILRSGSRLAEHLSHLGDLLSPDGVYRLVDDHRRRTHIGSQ
jgi:hypothetical protein